MKDLKRALCLGSSRWSISCTTMYSIYSDGFLARSVLSRMFLETRLQLPHLVFIRCTKNRSTFTPMSGSHLAIKGGTAFLTCSRYHSSTMVLFFFCRVPGRIRDRKSVV